MSGSMMDGRDKRFLFLVGSSRKRGNTELLAARAAIALPDCFEQRWLYLMDVPLVPFSDIRHGPGNFPTPIGNERILLKATLAATDLVFAVPLYWYTVPASAKLYLDYWTAWLRSPEFGFAERMREKTMWVVCTASSDDPGHAAPLLGMLRLTADYLGMKWGGALLGCGNRPGEVFDDPLTGARADAFFLNAAGGHADRIEGETGRREAADARDDIGCARQAHFAGQSRVGGSR